MPEQPGESVRRLYGASVAIPVRAFGTPAAEQDDFVAGYRGKLVRGELLGRYTTFRIGGPADWYAEPVDAGDLAVILLWARGRELPITVLGGGSNLLISDDGLRGLTVRLSRMKSLRFEDGDLIAEAGLPLTSLLRRASDRGLSGLDGVVGVPGAVGGALAMNAGTPLGEFGDHLIEAEILRPDGSRAVVGREALGLAYRSSAFRQRGEIVLSVRLRLPPGNPEEIRARFEEVETRRRATQPLHLPSAGCIWKNPKPDTAGRLIDKAGCKGMREGGAEVSILHANFIVNRGGARAADVARLMKRVRRRVEERDGILLRPEVQILGASEWEEEAGRTGDGIDERSAGGIDHRADDEIETR